MKGRVLIFSGPRKLEFQEREVLQPQSNEILIKTQMSAISAGSELLVYRGMAPEGLPADSTITALRNQSLQFPLAYGYSLVGEIIDYGPGVDPALKGERVFVFHPHQEYVIVRAEEILPIPPDISSEDAVLFPAVETAVNLTMDGHPLLGEHIIIFGQGFIGLLLTAIISRYPLISLITVDKYANRRELSARLGASHTLNPDEKGYIQEIADFLAATNADGAHRAEQGRGADVIFELSGDPRVLTDALNCLGFGGRLIIGSWYGRKAAEVSLGGPFHRNRIKIISSQVSTIAPELSARWSKKRRYELTWQVIRQIHPSQLITHRIPFPQAPRAYRLLDTEPDKTLQTVLTYETDP
ncbi:MAG: zinc-binding alcohol dehydrogenase [Calditrichia bacterium]